MATFVGADEIASAKVVATFAKKNEIVKIFGGIVDGKVVDAAMVKSLSGLPSKLELLGKLVGSLNRPIADFVQVNAGIIRALPNVLNAYKATKA